MFVDFNKVFNSKPQPQLEVPAAMLSYLNGLLPEGVKYVADSDGNCVVATDQESVTIGGYYFKPTPEQQKVLGSNYTQDDVLKYFYNAQKPIPLQLKKDGFITLNGMEFPVERLNYNPHHPIKYVSDSFHMIPAPFPDPFPLTIGCEGYQRILNISRVPNESVNIAAFESDKNDPLLFQYFLNETTQSMKINLSFNLNNAKRIRDIVETTSIYNAYLDGKGFLLGKPLLANLEENHAKPYDTNSLEFWKKVLSIEECLDVAFSVPQEDIDVDTIYLVEQLYQNLVNHTPVRDRNKVDSINGHWETADQKNIRNNIGQSIYFEFDSTRTINLFGIKLTLPGILGIFNAVLSDYVKKGKTEKIYLTDVSDTQPRYTSILCFKSEEELIAYKENDYNERIAAFCNAKKISDYLT